MKKEITKLEVDVFGKDDETRSKINEIIDWINSRQPECCGKCDGSRATSDAMKCDKTESFCSCHHPKGEEKELDWEKEKAEKFLEYVRAHPGQRFWQALLNFTGLPYIAISPRPPKDISKELEDTFYLDY